MDVNDLMMNSDPAQDSTIPLSVVQSFVDDFDTPDMPGVPKVVAPKPVAYGESYAHAHSAQRNAGRIAAAAPRAPQALIKKPTAEELKAAEAARQQQATAAAKKVKPSGAAVVKAVLSGDTLLLRLPAPQGTIPPEKTISLSGITAPRCGRGKKAQDEPFGWESREFLRKKAIGQIVFYEVSFTLPNGKDVGLVKLGGPEGENLAHAVVAAGLANVAPGNARKDGSLHPDRQALVELKEKAEQESAGMWSKSTKAEDHLRTVDWNPETKARALFEASKGKVLSGIVDQVRDGSTLRVELTDSKLHHKIMTLYLSGVQAPRIPLPRQVRDEENPEEKKTQPAEAPEPFALAAREFVEQRLLHREVGVVLQGVDKNNNFFGSVIVPQGNISVALLRQGLAKLVPWSAALTAEANELAEAESAARGSSLNIWREDAALAGAAPVAAAGSSASDRPASSKDSKMQGSVHNESFEAKVIQIVSGDTIVVQDRANTTRRIQLSSIIAPRMFNRNQKGQGNGQPWSNESKEFLRKKLIGKKVRIHVDYTRPAPAESKENAPRAYASVFLGKSNLAEQVVAAGLATVAPHRIEDPRSAHYDALLAAEDKAKAEKIGVHSNQAPKVIAPVDLTDRPRPAANASDEEKAKAESTSRQLSAKAKQYLPFLQKEKALRGVVEYVFSGSRTKLLIPSQNCMISFILSGVRCPTTNTKDKKPEPYADEVVAYIRSTLMQQDVRIEVETLDRGDNFIGALFFGATNIAVDLLEKGYASVISQSADRSKYKTELYAAEEKARSAKINIWKNWVPPKEEPKEEEKKSEEAPLSQQEQLLNVTVTEIVDPAKFYVHIVGDQGIQFVEDSMRDFAAQGQLPAPANFAPKKGNVCAGQFDEDSWCRVKIEKRISDDDYEVVFMDYGNTEVLSIGQLRPIENANLRNVAPLARPCTLAGLKGPHADSDQFDFARHTFYQMVWDKQLLAKVELRDNTGTLHVTLHEASSPTSINQQLLQDGLVRIKSRPEYRLRSLCEAMQPIQKAAQDERVGIWEFGVVSDPEEEGDSDRSLGPRKRV